MPFYPFTLAILADPSRSAYIFTVPPQRLSFEALDVTVKRPKLSRDGTVDYARSLYEELKRLERQWYKQVADAQDVRHGGASKALIDELRNARSKAKNASWTTRLSLAAQALHASLGNIAQTLSNMEHVRQLQVCGQLEHCFVRAKLRERELSRQEINQWQALIRDAEDVAVLFRWHEFTLMRLAWEIDENWRNLM